MDEGTCEGSDWNAFKGKNEINDDDGTAD